MTIPFEGHNVGEQTCTNLHDFSLHHSGSCVDLAAIPFEGHNVGEQTGTNLHALSLHHLGSCVDLAATFNGDRIDEKFLDYEDDDPCDLFVSSVDVAAYRIGLDDTRCGDSDRDLDSDNNDSDKDGND